jgi:hypothetical protein
MAGADRIAKERQRQITAEGWTAEHDDEHRDGELAAAAACYAIPDLLFRKKEYANEIHFVDPWPWNTKWDKRPHPNSGNVVAPNSAFYVGIDERLRQLEKAGALIAAEIDRLERVKASRREEPK